MKNILYWFIEDSIHFGMTRCSKMGLALNGPNRLLFIQFQTLPPSMHHKWKEIIDSVCGTTNGRS